ncbi:MAG TPA: lipopolysaccharide transport periplasmic protein LptA [Arenicellales bacterium]|nr:lipopolysaccharide transport periplasmic protein LptA [Arenicellales bacterium]
MRLLILTAASLLALAASTVHALESDRSQPATIEADEVEFDFRTGTRTYKGNVVVVQGTLRITGDKLVVQYNNENEQIEKATSWGDPATFKQRPEGKEHDVYGEGREIVLNEMENTLTLIENAVMTQAGNTAKGNQIVYDMSTDKMTVKGLRQQQRQAESEDGGDEAGDEGDGRARVVISPEEQQGTAAGAGDNAEAESSDSGEASGSE